MSRAETLGQSSSDQLIPGVSPQLYNINDFDRISKLVNTISGIVLNETKRMLVYSRIAPLVRAAGAKTFNEFLFDLDSDPFRSEKVIEALTTNHTYFYREPHHYEHFANVVRPELLSRAAAGEPVRIWSAACSSGEEIYTLLMMLLGTDRLEGLRIAKSDILALGCDLAERAVTAARQAVYPADALNAIPPALQKPWHSVENGRATIAPQLRQMVRFRCLNLLKPWPFKSHFDVIFCRNVMIYFDGPTKEGLLLNLARQVRPGGYLYIGHSERVSGAAAELLTPVGQTVYQRNLS